MLIGGPGLLIRTVDATLSAIIDLFYLILRILYLLRVLGSLLPYLINFGLNGGGGVANVLFGGAPTCEQSTRQDARCRKESFHSFKNLVCHLSNPRASVRS
jgi:hypothetical protein